MVQIRNMPENMHRTFKVRAAKEGMSLSDYLLRELGELAERPTTKELLERLKTREPVKVKTEPWKIIRQHRDGKR